MILSSKFDLEIKNIPGPGNYVAEAMSRWAYPASSSSEDISYHGSLAASMEIAKMLEKEHVVERIVVIIRSKIVGETTG